MGNDALSDCIQGFGVKSIQQGSPVPGATNTLTVTLATNYNLTGESIVTITGLTGSQTANTASLAVKSTSSCLGATGLWTQSTGPLVLAAASAGTTSGIACTVTFSLANPASAQSSPAVSVSATLANSMGVIAQAVMTKPGTALYGVALGLDPLTVVVPELNVKSIQQSTPVPCATNTLTVTLAANMNIADGPTVTIIGLTGSQTANTESLAVKSTPTGLKTTGEWTQSTGQLVLTAASGGITSGTAYEVTFQLTNSCSAQSSPAVSVSATLANGMGFDCARHDDETWPNTVHGGQWH